MQRHQTGSGAVGRTFNPRMPWDGVCQFAAGDNKFWSASDDRGTRTGDGGRHSVIGVGRGALTMRFVRR